MRKRKIVLFSSLIFFLFLFGFLLTKANTEEEEQIAKIESDGSAKIDKHEVCRNVVNSGNNEVMVPLKTKEEWCSFITAANNLSNVTLTTCVDCYCLGRCCNRKKCTSYNVGSCP